MTEDNKENNRTPRSAETRAIKDTARKPWRPPSMLETPPAPEGFYLQVDKSRSCWSGR
jgi:hypothetical protein